MKKLKLVVAVVAIALFASCKSNNEEAETIDASKIKTEGEAIIAELTSPPFVPAPVGDRPAKKLIVNLEIIEQEVI